MTLAEDSLQLAGLDAIHARMAANAVTVQSFETGDIIARRGESLKNWLYIASGIVAGSIHLDDGSIVPSFFYREGHWLGDHGIILRRPLNADWVALGATTLLAVDANTYLQLLNEAPDFANQCLRRMAVGLNVNADLMVFYKVADPFLRCVYILALLAELAPRTPDLSAESSGKDSLSTPVSQDFPAKLSGLSRSRYSEYLQELQDRGLVSLAYKTFHILKVDAWRKWMDALRHQRIIPATTTHADSFAQEIAAICADGDLTTA